MTDIETMAAQARAKLMHSVHTKAVIAKRAIASPRFDYCATFEGYEPGDPVGYGSTREAAETDLMEQVYEAADH